MPPSKGPTDALFYRRGSIYTLARLFGTSGVAPQPAQSLHLTVIALLPALMAVCGTEACAQTAVGDRYSGEVYIQPTYRQAAAPSGPTLSWPGKATEAASQISAASATPPSSGFAAQTRAPAYAYAAQAYQPPAFAAYQPPVAQPSPYQPPAHPPQVAQGASTQAREYGAPPVSPWYQRYGAASSAPSPVAPPPYAAQSSAPAPLAGAPQSIYDPPAGRAGATSAASTTVSSAARAPPAPVATAANDGETARYYSLHRQYGLTPDPDPIPPQFFTRTADLSDPPGPSPVYKAASSSSGSTTAVHAVQPDDATSTLGQP
jgi:Meckel syndrome type 1 protein